MTRRRVVLTSYVLLASVAGITLACGSPAQDGTGESETSDDTPLADLPEGDGDPEPLCDVAQLPALEPLWIEREPEGPLGGPFIWGIAVTDDAILTSGGYFQPRGEPPNYHLIRRALDGQQDWALDVPALGRMLETDGVHLYYNDGVLHGTLSRVTIEGIHEPWSMPYPGGIPAGQLVVGIDQPTFILHGSDVTEAGDPPFTDAFVALVEKNGDHISTFWFGELGQDETALRATEVPGGGFYVAFENAGSIGPPLSIRSYGVQGSEYSADLGLSASLGGLVALDDGLLVGGAHAGSVWTSKLGSTGEELWRSLVEPCGTASVRYLFHLARTSDRLWGVAWIEDGSMDDVPVLVQLGFDGRLLGSFRVAGLTAGARINQLESHGEAVVIAGLDPDAPEGPVSYLARLQ